MKNKPFCDCVHLGALPNSKHSKCYKCGQVWEIKDGKWAEVKE